MTAEDRMIDAIIEQASAWHARHLSGELTAEEKVKFLQWLQDNPHNVGEYLLGAQLAKLMPEALAGLGENAQETDSDDPKVIRLNPPRATQSEQRSDKSLLRRFLPLATAAALICTMSYFGARHYLSRDVLQVAVAHGDQRTLQLVDGSTVHLNSESKARVRYSEQERLIELEEGQGMFKVARDPHRPFRVRAGRAEVVALGTQFDVHQQPGHVTVTVLEGKVAVHDRGTLFDSLGSVRESTDDISVNLSAGEQIQVGGVPKPQVVKPADVGDATAWVRRQVVFKDRPLGDVAEEFNRYLNVPVRIEDEVLRDIHVSGIFSAYDQEGFIAFLKEFDGVRVEVGHKAIHVSREESH